MPVTTNDPLATKQSWLYDKIGLDKLLGEYKGSGIKVGIYDDGVQANHKDLAGNYDASLEATIGGVKVSPGVGTHGTAVAGIIAAVGNNGIGGVGIASEAKIAGVNMFSGATSGAGMVEAIKQMAKFDVTNSSWNWTTKYADPITGSFGKSFQAAIDYAVDNGRGGLGTVIVNSAGNDWLTDRRDANTSGFDQTRETITVGAVADTGFVASYANRGANILLSAPSSGGSKGISTLDIEGTGGYSSGDTYDYFGGTSAAAPVVSAVAALMLDANPDLGWRDVKEILAMSADHTGSAIGSAPVSGEAFGWKVNGATEFNGGGMHYSNDYGFGQLDAYTAVRMAEVWSLFDTAHVSANEMVSSKSGTVSKALTDNGVTSFTIAVTENMRLEHVDLTLKLTHPNVNELQVELISPDGTQSIVLTPGTGAAFAANNWSWTYGSEQFLGGLSAGTWTVKITDTKAGNTGSVASYTLDMYGSAADANNVYHYTDEFAKMLATNAALGTLTDANGGVDWINAAGIAQNVTLNLNAGVQSKIGTSNFITIASGSVIENAATGDGNDTLTGNSVANALYGMRGNDTIEGGAGADTIDGGVGNDTAAYAGSTDAVVVDLAAATQVGGDAQGDKLVGIENVTGSNYNDTLKGDAGVNTLRGGNGDDVLDGRAGADTVDGGAGSDTASYATSAAGVTIDLTAATQIGGDAQGDVLTAIENVVGSAYNDNLKGDANANALSGGDGNDLLVGRGGADTIDGGAGVDTASYDTSTAAVTVDLMAASQAGGDAQGDKLSAIENLVGSAYADVLKGDANANTLSALAGNDLLEGRGGADIIDGGAGTDTAAYESSSAGVTVDLLAATQLGGDAQGDKLIGIESLTGSSYSDILRGDVSANTLKGGAGDDTLEGRGGADVIDGGAGIDIASYESSAAAIVVDTTTGAIKVAGADATGDTFVAIEGVRGTNLSDTFTGGASVDRFYGMAGNDTLDGGAGADVLDGGAGIDTVSFGRSTVSVNVDLMRATQLGGDAQGDLLIGIEAITGSNYNDVVRGEANANTLKGGNGDDILEGRGGADVLDGGAGFDIASYESSSAAVVIDATKKTAIGGDGAGDTLIAIEGFRGSAYADTFLGSTAADYFDGGEGADTFFGSAGTDTILGGGGSDLVSYASSTAAVNINLATGVVSGGDAQGDKISGMENVIGTSYADRLVGDIGSNILRGGNGDDYLDGGANGDVLEGGSGIDTVDYTFSTAAVTVNLSSTGPMSGGYAQNDYLRDIENLTGSAYNDVLTGSTVKNIITAGSGNDIIEGLGGGDVINAGAGNDVIRGGGAGKNTLNGDAGTDTVSYVNSTQAVIASLVSKTGSATGGLFTDTFSAIENLEGSAFNDQLLGDGLANVLNGLGGNDRLTGGAGADTFVFSKSFGNDYLTDFKIGTDKLMLQGTGLNWSDLSIGGTAACAVITCGSLGTITLNGINGANLHQSDFLFAA